MLEVYTQIRSFAAKFVCGTFGEASGFCGNDKGCLAAAVMLTTVPPYRTLAAAVMLTAVPPYRTLSAAVMLTAVPPYRTKT
jgi:hypothetical protein